MNKLTKTRIINVMVLQDVVLYGCETRTTIKAMEKKIGACETWIWRSMLRVAWAERRTNKSILHESGKMRGDMSALQRSTCTRQKMMFSGT